MLPSLKLNVYAMVVTRLSEALSLWVGNPLTDMRKRKLCTAGVHSECVYVCVCMRGLLLLHWQSAAIHSGCLLIANRIFALQFPW